jgi:hypothetical protein
VLRTQTVKEEGWDMGVLVVGAKLLQFMSTGSIVLYPCAAQNEGKISFLRRTTTIDSRGKRQPYGVSDLLSYVYGLNYVLSWVLRTSN